MLKHALATPRNINCLNLVKLNQIWILITLFRLIWYHNGFVLCQINWKSIFQISFNFTAFGNHFFYVLILAIII